MALIPGTLPNDTCYGTPQDLLELFAQYLDVPALALNSKVFFSNDEPNASDAIWFDTNTSANPILKIKIGGNWTDYVSNYVENATIVTAATGDYVLISDVSDSGNAKKVTAQSIANLAPTFVVADGSITAPKLSGNQTGSAPIFGVRAWVLYDGNAVGGSVLGSGNVSSVTDVGTGRLTLNFTVAMQDTNYALAGSGQRSAVSGDDPVVVGPWSLTPFTTTTCEIVSSNLGNNPENSPKLSAIILR
jgi:hypothetical protein